jgi:HD-GYP domain-containing protein (c-di-GMP phosphodiesterase class II)
MKTITVNSLRPGQIFSEPVYIDDTNLLVPANIPVRKRDIQHLISWGIETVTTDGDLVTPGKADDSPGTAVIAPGKADGKAGFLSRAMHKITGTGSAAPVSARPAATPAPAAMPAIRPATAPVAQVPARPETVPTAHPAARPSTTAAPGRKRTISVLSLKEVQDNQEEYRAYISLIKNMENIFDAYTGKRGISPLAIDGIVYKLLAGLREQKGRIVGFILGGKARGHRLAISAVNTAILSARMAMALRLHPREVLQVISVALLRDIGMLDLPKTILEGREDISGGELRLIQSHPAISRRIILEEIGLPDDVALAAWQHHERWDGNGYPKKLAGEDIDIRARIVAVADAFDGMINAVIDGTIDAVTGGTIDAVIDGMIGGRSSRIPMEGSRALKAIYAGGGRRFDPAVVGAFIRTMAIYPAGSFVKLNNNALCRVFSVAANAPLRPKVEMLIDENGRTFRPGEGKVYDLIQEKDIFITQALDSRRLYAQSAANC